MRFFVSLVSASPIMWLSVACATEVRLVIFPIIPLGFEYSMFILFCFLFFSVVFGFCFLFMFLKRTCFFTGLFILFVPFSGVFFFCVSALHERMWALHGRVVMHVSALHESMVISWFLQY